MTVPGGTRTHRRHSSSLSNFRRLFVSVSGREIVEGEMAGRRKKDEKIKSGIHLGARRW